MFLPAVMYYQYAYNALGMRIKYHKKVDYWSIFLQFANVSKTRLHVFLEGSRISDN